MPHTAYRAYFLSNGSTRQKLLAALPTSSYRPYRAYGPYRAYFLSNGSTRQKFLAALPISSYRPHRAYGPYMAYSLFPLSL